MSKLLITDQDITTTTTTTTMLMRAATVVQVLQDLFCVLLQLLVVAAIILSFKFYRKFYCMFYFTCDRSLSETGGCLQVKAPYIPECSGPGDSSLFDEYDEEPIMVSKTEKYGEEFKDF